MKEKRNIILFSIFAVMLLALGSVGAYYWYNSAYFVSTEDAKLNGDLVKISPQISGRLLEFNAEEGDLLTKDQILGRQEMVNLADSSIDLAVIRAPINGMVIKKQANIGEIISAGQSLAYVADLSKLYITANIEETKLTKVHPGQQVDIRLDQYQGEHFSGKVSSIGLASNSTFSIIPTSASGNFTKVVQKIPVKISFDGAGRTLLPGVNAVVKIHIK
jgi:multidrug resistance efflux pump